MKTIKRQQEEKDGPESDPSEAPAPSVKPAGEEELVDAITGERLTLDVLRVALLGE